MKGPRILAIAFAFSSGCIAVSAQQAPQDDRQYFIRYLTIDDGLVDNSVNCVIKDKFGFIWAGTANGLSRYDGLNFKNYQNSDDSGSISHNNVRDLFEDSRGDLWVATAFGLNRYDRASDSFHRFMPGRTTGPDSLSYGTILDIQEDKRQRLLLATNGGGLNILDSARQGFTHYRFDANAPGGLHQDYVYQLVPDNDEDVVWIGLGGMGLQKLDLKTDKFTLFKIPAAKPEQSFYANVVRAMHKEGDTLWIGTFDALKAFSVSTNEFIDVQSIFPSIRSQEWCLSIANVNNDIWVGTSAEASAIHTRSGGAISKGDASNAAWGRELNDAVINDIFYDHPFVWIATNNGGINLIDLRSRRLNVSPVSHPVAQGKVKFIYEMEDGALLVAGLSGLIQYAKNGNAESLNTGSINVCKAQGDVIAYGGGSGLVLKNRKDKSWVQLTYNNEDTMSLSHNLIRDLHFDLKRNIVWTLTETGLCSVDLSTKKVRRHSYPRSSASKLLFLGDSILVSTSAGLRMFDITTKRYRPFLRELDIRRITNVNDLFMGSRGEYVVASWKGLAIVDPRSKKFRIITQKEGLPNDVILAVEQDKLHRYWISTAKGLCLLQLQDDSIRTHVIDRHDGLPTSVFSQNASLTKQDGNLVFGTVAGMVELNPADFTFEYATKVPVILSIESGIPGLSKYVAGDPSVLESIELPYSVNSLSIGFSNLDPSSGNKSRYQYRLLPADHSWLHAPARQANFTNLPPGIYTLQIRATNRDGVWSQPRELKIAILPPPWRTAWAYAGYALLAAIAIWLARRNIITRERLKAELKLEHVKAEKLQEVNDFKSKFFANISHEFRTPLALIRGQAEELIAKKNNAADALESIKRNSHSVLQLVNQMLDLSRIDSGMETIDKKPVGLKEFLKIRIEAFGSFAQQKDVTLRADYPSDDVVLLLDASVIEKMLNNLLSNAIKYTPSGGAVSFGASYHSGVLTFTITDTGIGIADEHKERIFERFFRASSGAEGTGIGLALTRELIRLHGGDIGVQSDLSRGTTFTVKIPCEQVTGGEATAEDNKTALVEPEIGTLQFERAYSSQKNDKPLVLIAEDNDELRNFIRRNLSPEFGIITAENAEKAWVDALQQIPDVVITDWMMPGMSGVDLCRKLKDNEATSHIPVVMLTARANIESKLEGLETGADEYMAKPFDMRELRIRIRNLVAQRQLWREKFSKEGIAGLHNARVATPDEKFLQKFHDAVNAGLADPALSVEGISREIGVSRVQLHRKLVALTGHSASELIRDYRLQRAADLLRQKAGNVSEIAFQVGFENLSYFARSFKQKYHVNPSEYFEKISS